jgi:hypothetical protein
MSKKAQIVSLIAVGIIAIAGLFMPWATRTAFGTAAPSGSISRFTAVGSQYGYYLGTYGNETQVIDDSGNVNLGTSGTAEFWTLGGVDYASVQVSMAASSTFPCAITNPFGTATSTMLNHIVQVTSNGIGSAQLLDVSTSSTAYASSSPAFVKAYSAAAGQFTQVWTPGIGSTTRPGILGYDSFSPNGDSPYVVGPSQFVTTRIATGTPGTFASYYTGTCSATFMKP